MASPKVDRAVQWSVLDRLIDNDPSTNREPPMSWAQSVRELKLAVRRDLEWLLNTRRIVDPAPEGFTELPRSLFHFGIPDITSLGARSVAARDWLRHQVEETITLFEPRLAGVRVTVAPPAPEGRQELRFIVEGLLRMEPTPEQVVYDTILEVASATFAIRGEGSGADA